MKPKSKCTKVLTIGGVSTVAITLILIFSSQASAFSLNDLGINQVIQQIQSQVTNAQNYFHQIASGNLQAIGKLTGVNVSQIISDATGALGIPDPITSSKTIAQQVQVPNQSTIDLSQSTIANVNGEVTKQAASTVLSQAGQNQLNQEANNVSNTIASSANNANNVYSQAQTAISSISTQDVLKQIAQQNAEISQQQANLAAVNGSINTNLQRSVQAQNLANINLANINSAVNGANQKSNMETVATGRENLERAASSKLY